MSDIVVPNNYVSLVHRKDFRNICQPLLAGTDIAACYFCRTYKNGIYFHLTTDEKIDEFLLSKCSGEFLFDVRLLDTIYNGSLPNKNKVHVFTEELDNIRFLSPFNKQFNIISNFNVIEKINNHYDTFWFITKTERPMHGFYVNHYDVLERFMLYFKEEGRDLIRAGEKNPATWINTNPNYLSFLKNLKENVLQKKALVSGLKDSFKLRKYPLSINNTKVYLTARELDCLICLSKGFSYKEIGNFLRVSDRTVETHIQHIKHKLGVTTQTQLLKTYYSSDLTIYDPKNY